MVGGTGARAGVSLWLQAVSKGSSKKADRHDLVWVRTSFLLQGGLGLPQIIPGLAIGDSGMRESEILTLEHHQIGLNRETMTLNATNTDAPRVFTLTGPVTDGAVSTLAGTARHITRRLAFWHGGGEAYRNFTSSFPQQRAIHDVPFRLHDLRHKFGVEYLRYGGNIYGLQQIMGHSSIKTTERYLAYLTPEEAAAAKHASA